MIKQVNKLTTEVVFGNHENACIAVEGSAPFNGELILRELKKGLKKNVGAQLTPEEIEELPKIVMDFSRIESVDVLIKALEYIKKGMEMHRQFALAC